MSYSGSLLGEYIESTGITTSVITGYANAHSLVLQPGDWDVWGWMNFVGSGLDSSTEKLLQIGISTTSATVVEKFYETKYAKGWTFTNSRTSCGPRRISVSAATQVYLVVNQTTSAGTAGTMVGVDPTIFARRRK